MNNKIYDVCCYIGRLEPPHLGHIQTILEAFNHAKHVLVILGSDSLPRTLKNPWTTKERMEMILSSIPFNFHERISFLGAKDYLYSDTEWLQNVTKDIRETSKILSHKDNPEISLIAFSKDESSYYLNYFKFLNLIPMYEIKTSSNDNGSSLSSTKIRELYFDGYLNFLKHVCHEGTIKFLENFYKTEDFKLLKEEWDDALKYQKKFETAPYGYTNFVTVDNVVIQSGHILLIQRGLNPGKGLWALPGGHLDCNETFLDGAIRELREETNLKVPEKVLKGSVYHSHIFDHPDRSLRCRVGKKIGRTITMAFGIKLDDASDLAKVRASSDASLARWIPIDIVLNEMRDKLFEDHYDIVNYMVNRI